MSRTIIGLAALALVASACTQSDVPGDRFVVEDSAGVAIATSQSPRVPVPVLVDPNPLVMISAEFAAPEHILVFPDYATRLSDGTVVVGNTGTSELLFFSPEGVFLGAVGRQGQGPGEFQRFFGLFRCGNDQLVVVELSRLSIIDGRSMRFERNVQISGHLTETRALLAGVHPDCSAALIGSPNVPPASPGGQVFDTSISLYWADFATGERDSIGTFAATQLYSWETQGRTVPVRAPYGQAAVWAAHPAGVAFAPAGDATYVMLSPGGRVQQVVRWAAPASPVTDQDWEYFERSREDLIQDHPEEAASQPPRGLLPRPERKPPYAGIQVDETGRVWIQTYDRYSVRGPESSPAWWVFTPEGEWLAEIRMPERMKVLWIGETTVIGAVRDELDLDHIQIHQFRLAESNVRQGP